MSEFHDGQQWWLFAYLPEQGQNRTPVGLTNGEDSYFILADQVGTPLALATTDGHVVQTMQYDSFGNLLQVRGNAVRLPLGFAGGLYDAETGLTRFPWRDYDADTGRFTALDPLGKKGGDSDWYGYCVDDPVNRVDVLGLAVQVCKRPTDINRLRWTNHYWLKTDTQETGVGRTPGQIPGQNGNSDGFGVPTQWIDHTGQSREPNAVCVDVPNVDENCVNALTREGNEAGIFFPSLTDCQTNASEVLNYCRNDDQ